MIRFRAKPVSNTGRNYPVTMNQVFRFTFPHPSGVTLMDMDQNLEDIEVYHPFNWDYDHDQCTWTIESKDGRSSIQPVIDSLIARGINL